MSRDATVLCLLLFYVFPIAGVSQVECIKFESQLNWHELQLKAKAENKFIFVDCYATWCGPCKMMDNKVYTNDCVAKYFNANFISIKLQMDTSKSDDENTKMLYTEACNVRLKNGVQVFPTYLFFNPAGRLVHEGIGYKRAEDFIKLGQESTNQKTQYFTLLTNFQHREFDFSSMAYLAQTAFLLRKDSIAFEIGNYYIGHYLANLKDSLLFNKQNVTFLTDFTRTSHDIGFSIIYQHTDKINEILKDSQYAKSIICYIISKEEIDPILSIAIIERLETPDWGHIKNAIVKKYSNVYASRIILDAQIRWYRYKKNWREYTKSVSNLFQEYGSTMNNNDLNDNALVIFDYSTDKKELNDAISWMEKVLKNEKDSANSLPAYLDTYANLLYKVGRSKDDAIKAEEKALFLANTYKIRNYIEEYEKAIDKMRKGEKTWIEN